MYPPAHIAEAMASSTKNLILDMREKPAKVAARFGPGRNRAKASAGS
jgi:hypothetical protein